MDYFENFALSSTIPLLFPAIPAFHILPAASAFPTLPVTSVFLPLSYCFSPYSLISTPLFYHRPHFPLRLFHFNSFRQSSIGFYYSVHSFISINWINWLLYQNTPHKIHKWNKQIKMYTVSNKNDKEQYCIENSQHSWAYIIIKAITFYLFMCNFHGLLHRKSLSTFRMNFLSALRLFYSACGVVVFGQINYKAMHPKRSTLWIRCTYRTDVNKFGNSSTIRAFYLVTVVAYS